MATLVKPKSKRKGKPTQVSSVWHICFWDRSRKRTRLFSTMCRRRKNAERKLRQFIDLLESGEYYEKFAPNNPFLVAIESRAKEQQTLAIDPLLVAYEQALAAGQVRKRGKGKPPTAEHVRTAMARLRKIVAGLRTATDLTPEKVASAVGKHTTTQQTAKHYERTVKAFSAWLCSSGKLPADPLAAYEVCEVSEVVHNRGPFSWEQVVAIVAAARESEITHRGLSGSQRSLLWQFLAGTGFRAGEAAAVRKRDFGPELAFVVLSGQHTKNGKEAKQPLPPFLRKALAPYVATLADEDFLWPGRWVDRPIAMLELDATKVGVLVGRKHADANGGVVYDVHAFRHFFATMIDRVGVSERLARKLARTSSSALLDRYTTREFAELTAAVEGFPSIRVGGG